MYVCPPSYYCMFVPTTALCFSSHKQNMFVPPILYVSPPYYCMLVFPPKLLYVYPPSATVRLPAPRTQYVCPLPVQQYVYPACLFP